MQFIHKKKSVSGYRFGQKTFYSNFHLGTDWKADFEDLYAPTDGEVIATPYGKQGGQWCHFKDINGYLHRFGHLSKIIVKSGKVKEGTVLAITGNSGSLSQFPHDHHDLWTTGVLDLKGRKGLIDPEVYFKGIGDVEKTTESNLIQWQLDALQYGRAHGIKPELSPFSPSNTAYLIALVRKLTDSN